MLYAVLISSMRVNPGGGSIFLFKKADTAFLFRLIGLIALIEWGLLESFIFYFKRELNLYSGRLNKSIGLVLVGLVFIVMIFSILCAKYLFFMRHPSLRCILNHVNQQKSIARESVK